MKVHGGIFLCCYLVNAIVFAVPHIQVRIGKNLQQVLIHGMDLQSDIFVNNQRGQYLGRKAIRFDCSGSASVKEKAILLASLSSPTGLISWGNRSYRGNLQVTTSENFDACDLVQNISMENYLSSLLAKEMGGGWPLEALKAQAIAARTYALVKKEQNQFDLFTLENSERHQVSGSFFDETWQTRVAALATKGRVLVNDEGKIVPAFFHSKCGGRTYLPSKVWSARVAGYRSVKCPYCHHHGKGKWQKRLVTREVRAALLATLSEEQRGGSTSGEKLQLVEDGKNRDDIKFYWRGRVERVPKPYLRKRFGRKELPSNNFTIRQGSGGFMIKGEGLGHGVGMCQYGALEMARRGKNHRQILAHYYPRLKVKRLY